MPSLLIDYFFLFKQYSIQGWQDSVDSPWPYSFDPHYYCKFAWFNQILWQDHRPLRLHQSSSIGSYCSRFQRYLCLYGHSSPFYEQYCLLGFGCCYEHFLHLNASDEHFRHHLYYIPMRWAQYNHFLWLEQLGSEWFRANSTKSLNSNDRLFSNLRL